METIIIVGIVAVVTFFATKNYINRLGKGCCGGSENIKVKDKNIKNYNHHVTCEVAGMHCTNCAKRIEGAFNNRGGIYTKANYKTGIVEIHLKENLEDSKIESIITSHGYEVKSIHR